VGVVVVPVVMVALPSCEGRTCANQQQNCGDDELLHAKQSSTVSMRRYDSKAASIKSANASAKFHAVPSNPYSVFLKTSAKSR
jgi:hypothetical protein